LADQGGEDGSSVGNWRDADVLAGSTRIAHSRDPSADWRIAVAIMALHWIWQLIGSERRSAARPERRTPPLMKIAVERLPDYRWRELGFVQARRFDETDGTR
jgi:hypothetical protein